jgi:hypothetical protein
MYIDDDRLKGMMLSASAMHLQQHHKSQAETNRLLAEQNELLAQQLAKANGLVRVGGVNYSPDEWSRKQARERQERADQLALERAERERQEAERARKIFAEKAKQKELQKIRIETLRLQAEKERAKLAEADRQLTKKAVSYLEKHAPDCEQSLQEKIDINFQTRRMAALVVAADGQFSLEEFEWVESFWGHGASKWLVEIMAQTTLQDVQAQLSKMCLLSKENSVIEKLKFQLSEGKVFRRTVAFLAIALQLEHLAAVDGITEGEMEIINKLKESIIGQRDTNKNLAVPEHELVAAFEDWKRANYMVYLGLKIYLYSR